MQKLTDAVLAALRPPASGRIELGDDQVPGLTLRVTASDQRTWAVRGRLPDGHRLRPTLGKYPAVGIREARRLARKVLGEMARGVDPTAGKRAAAEARSAAKAAPKVVDRFTAWREAKADGWSERYAAEVERIGDKVILPKLGDRVLRETTRADWVELVDALRKRTPAKAAWVYDAVSSFLNFCEARGSIDANPLPRRRGDVAPKVAARAHVLSDNELAKVWHASAGLTPKSRCFTRLLILTAARRDEVANIAAGEISLLKAQWTIPAERAKNYNALTVPLSALAAAELRRIWPEGAIGPGYRLLGAIKGSGLRAPSKIKARLDTLSGVSGWRLHDVRRSARTGMARLGVSDRAAEAALNHVSDRSRLVRTYDRHDYAREAIAALEVWQAHVERLVNEALPAEVAALHRKA